MVFSRKRLYLSSIVCLALAQLANGSTENNTTLVKRQVNPENLINVPTNPDWMKTIDFTDVNGAVRPITSGKCGAPKCDGSDNNDCYQDCGCLPHKSDVFGCSIPKTWALTFDDGPSEVTPALLDILKDKGVKATFCVLGAYAEQFPDILKRIYDEGHQIASHSYSHAHLMSLTNEEIVNELRATDEVIRRITGVVPRYVRPPFGEADERVKSLLEKMGYKVLMWNVDPHDYNVHMKPDGGQLIQNGFQDILDGKSNMYNVFNDPGYISLQHDLYAPSVHQVEKIIDLVKSYGYDMMPVNMCTGDSEMHNTPPVTAEHVKTSVKSSKPEKTEAHKPEQVKEEKPEKQVNEEEEEETDETMQAASHPESSADSNIVVAEMNAENSGPQKDTKASGANKLTISLATIPLGLTQLFI